MPHKLVGPGRKVVKKNRKKTDCKTKLTKKSPKPRYASKKLVRKPCTAGKRRNTKTGRCIDTLKTKKSKCKSKGKIWQNGKCFSKRCNPGCQYRSKSTKRCRNFEKRKACCDDPNTPCREVARKLRSRRVR